MINYILFVLYTAFIFFIGKRAGEKAPDCAHKWEIIGKISDKKRHVLDSGETYFTITNGYQIQCDNCGDIKVRWMQ